MCLALIDETSIKTRLVKISINLTVDPRLLIALMMWLCTLLEFSLHENTLMFIQYMLFLRHPGNQILHSDDVHLNEESIISENQVIWRTNFGFEHHFGKIVLLLAVLLIARWTNYTYYCEEHVDITSSSFCTAFRDFVFFFDFKTMTHHSNVMSLLASTDWTDHTVCNQSKDIKAKTKEKKYDLVENWT